MLTLSAPTDVIILAIHFVLVFSYPLNACKDLDFKSGPVVGHVLIRTKKLDGPQIKARFLWHKWVRTVYSAKTLSVHESRKLTCHVSDQDFYNLLGSKLHIHVIYEN